MGHLTSCGKWRSSCSFDYGEPFRKAIPKSVETDQLIVVGGPVSPEMFSKRHNVAVGNQLLKVATCSFMDAWFGESAVKGTSTMPGRN